MKIVFSERQNAIISTALATLAVSVIVWIILRVFMGFLGFLSYFSSVFVPLATGLILSLLLRPLYEMLMEKAKMKPAAAIITLFSAVLIPLVGLLWFFGGMLVGQIVGLINDLPQVIGSVVAWAEKQFPDLTADMDAQDWYKKLQPVVANNFQVIASTVIGGINGFMGSIGGMLNWAVLPVYVIFFLLAPPFKREQLPDALPFLKPSTREDVVFLINEFVDIVVTFFRGQLLIALGQGIIMAIGFSIVGLKYGFVLGFLFGMLNIIPYLGNLSCIGVTLPLAYLQDGGGFLLLILVGVVIGITQLVEAYILTPKIMGDSTGLHPLVIIVAMFFWATALNGIVGMILAIPFTAFGVVLWQLIREKYMQEIL